MECMKCMNEGYVLRVLGVGASDGPAQNNKAAKKAVARFDAG